MTWWCSDTVEPDCLGVVSTPTLIWPCFCLFFFKPLCLKISNLKMGITVPDSLGCYKIKWVNTSVSNSFDTLWTLKAWAMLLGLVHILFYIMWSFSKLPQNTCTIVILFNGSSKIAMAPKYPHQLGVPSLHYVI